MPRITIKALSDTVDQLVERNQDQQLAIANLTERLDKAAQVVGAHVKRITALEEQEVKTRKQLWYLQKIAKGEFQPQVPKSNGNAQEEAHDASELHAAEHEPQSF